MATTTRHLSNGTVAEPFVPVAEAFRRLMGRGQGGGALVVRHRGETVASLTIGSADRAGRKRWTPETLGISFSTTKGISSTVVHRLAERGVLDYDDPVAEHWPAFAQGGKEHVTVRELMTHRAGLSSIQAVADEAEDILDFELMEERLAARETRAPTRRSYYHAVTYGWLIAGLVRGATGQGLQELVKQELAGPLQTDGLHIGAPEDAPERVAQPVGSALRHLGSAATVLAPLWTKATVAKAAVEALHLDGFHRLFEGEEPPIWTTEMPAVNGCFSADALARLYGTLANGGTDGDVTLLRPETVERLGKVHVRTGDAVLGLKMRWRLGYHQAFTTGRPSPMAFGHYGYGGSGGWADPSTGVSVGFVTNRIGSFSTPMGDLTLPRLNRVIHDCARRAGA